MEAAVSLLGGATLFALSGAFSLFIAGGLAEYTPPGAQPLSDEQIWRRRLPSRILGYSSLALAAIFALAALRAAAMAGA
jgi:hypothetical protein